MKLVGLLGIESGMLFGEGGSRETPSCYVGVMCEYSYWCSSFSLLACSAMLARTHTRALKFYHMALFQTRSS